MLPERLLQDRLNEIIIFLNTNAVRGAAALSIARYGTCLSFSLIMLIIRATFLWLYTPSQWQQAIILTSEIGRFIIVAAQGISIVTYSCQYKGIYTWGSPPFKCCCGKRNKQGPCWTTDEQKEFRNQLLNDIGRNYLAMMIFWTVVGIWPLLSSLEKAAKRWRLLPEMAPEIGDTIFSLFCSPADKDFKDDALAIIVSIYEEKPNAKENLIHEITFRNVPLEIYDQPFWHLSATRMMKLILAFPVFISAVAGLVSPVIFSLVHPNPVAQIYWIFEQVMVNAIKYYDFSDRTINTKFDVRPVASQYPEV